MPATVIVNFMTVVHASSTGQIIAFPDVCLTPAPPAPAPIPIPYPNIAMSSDTSEGSSTVKMDGNPIMLQDAKFSMSTGDEAGSAQGVVSHKIKGKAEFALFSFDVKVDGKMVPRLLDIMIANEMASKPPNTPPTPLLQPPNMQVPSVPDQSGDWDVESAGGGD
ncbi:MAG: DUF4150 domain-containing protein [Candidatus Eisenbacteria bacterium]|nr:DUF4150 domain-containing protein [Candidatus Eisenbacteria bacterium]MCC7143845.1 DUF4150 domain-containing protein [Candidatus Eisenbacteria bacterium]